MAPATAFSNRAGALSLSPFFFPTTNATTNTTTNNKKQDNKKKSATTTAPIFFNPPTLSPKTTTPPLSTIPPKNLAPSNPQGRNFLDLFSPSSDKKSGAKNLRKILEAGILEKSKIPASNDKQRYPVSVGVMFDYITSLITQWKPKCISKPLPKTPVFEEAYRYYRSF